MVRQGMAWVYRRYATDPALYQAEDAARAARRGLWADSIAIATLGLPPADTTPERAATA